MTPSIVIGVTRYGLLSPPELRRNSTFRGPWTTGCVEDLHNLWSLEGEGRTRDRSDGAQRRSGRRDCRARSAERSARPTTRPSCACARRASDALRDTRTAEAAAAEDFDPLRIRPYVELDEAEPDGTNGRTQTGRTHGPGGREPRSPSDRRDDADGGGSGRRDDAPAPRGPGRSAAGRHGGAAHSAHAPGLRAQHDRSTAVRDGVHRRAPPGRRGSAPPSAPPPGPAGRDDRRRRRRGDGGRVRRRAVLLREAGPRERRPRGRAGRRARPERGRGLRVAVGEPFRVPFRLFEAPPPPPESDVRRRPRHRRAPRRPRPRRPRRARRRRPPTPPAPRAPTRRPTPSRTAPSASSRCGAATRAPR